MRRFRKKVTSLMPLKKEELNLHYFHCYKANGGNNEDLTDKDDTDDTDDDVNFNRNPALNGTT